MAKRQTHSISEALEILEDTAQKKGADIKDLLGKDLEQIKKAFRDLGPYVKDVKEQVFESTSEAFEEGVKHAKKTASDLDEKVHDNPWPYIGGAAAIALIIGYILGRKD